MRVAVIPGDGIGKEVIPVAADVLRVALPDTEMIPVDAGYERFRREGIAMASEDMDMIKSCDCVLFGAVTSPPKKSYKSVILSLRTELGLYANIRPFRSFCISPYNVDLTIYRENSECLYNSIEEVNEDVVISRRKITRVASERIARAACQRPGIKKLTIVHKANVLKSCELFRDSCIRIATEMGVPYEETLVDTMAYQLVRDPSRYDTIVTTNLFGDILSDEAAALIGGLGLSPSANVGDKYALFEPVHGSAPDIAGRGIANPMAAVLSVSMLLQWAKHDKEADAVREAVRQAIDDGVLTPDLGGIHNTSDVHSCIIRHLEASL